MLGAGHSVSTREGMLVPGSGPFSPSGGRLTHAVVRDAWGDRLPVSRPSTVSLWARCQCRSNCGVLVSRAPTPNRDLVSAERALAPAGCPGVSAAPRGDLWWRQLLFLSVPVVTWEQGTQRNWLAPGQWPGWSPGEGVWPQSCPRCVQGAEDLSSCSSPAGGPHPGPPPRPWSFPLGDAAADIFGGPGP